MGIDFQSNGWREVNKNSSEKHLVGGRVAEDFRRKDDARAHTDLFGDCHVGGLGRQGERDSLVSSS